MSVNTRTDDDVASVVRYALETTRATAVCPFHSNVTIRVGDDAAEIHAYIRAHRIVKSDGTAWDREVLLEEFKHSKMQQMVLARIVRVKVIKDHHPMD